MVIWESWTAYSTDLCIDHFQHTEAEVIVEQMGSFEEDGALLITVMTKCSGELQWSSQLPHMSHRAELHGMPMNDRKWKN